jgi:hypothetical protein
MNRGAGVLPGLLAFPVAGLIGLAALSALWPAYASAVPTKAYSTAMLLSRLGVSVAASIVAGLVAGALGGPRASRTMGYVLTAVSAVIHVGIVWPDYPVWYHMVYLLSLVPITALAGLLPARIAEAGMLR